MIVRARLGNREWVMSLTRQALTVSDGDRCVAAYDRGGRLYSYYRDPDTYRRGLNGRVLHKRREPSGLLREWLDVAAAGQVVDAAADIASAAAAAFAGSRWDGGTTSSEATGTELMRVLSAAAAFRPAQAEADAECFRRVYSPIGILPPDQYLALVLQATHGCSFGTCTFCDLYHHAYRVRTAAEFRDHVEEVRAFMGASITLRERSIFLGAANALAVPLERLSAILEVTRATFTPAPPVHAFVDAFTGVRKSVADYRVLHALGLARVYIGLESGHDPLLSFVRKPGAARDAVETVRALAAAGVRAGVIVMLGLGGDRFADGHVRDTSSALNAMQLRAGDLIYFSDLVEIPGTSYPAVAAGEGVRPLGAAERQDQRRAILRALTFPADPPRVATYDIREFIY